MRRDRPRRRPVSEINVVPYIDVMLVLLVIFMATAPLLMQGVEVALAAADNAPLKKGEEVDPLVVTIDAQGQLWLNLGMPTAGEGPGRGATRVSLGNLADQATKILNTRPTIPVFVRGDAAVAYGAVIEVMSVLQKAGVRGVGLVTEPPELGSAGGR